MTYLLVALAEIAKNLGLMSVTKTEDRHYWHIVIFKRMGRLVLRLLGRSGRPRPDGLQYWAGRKSGEVSETMDPEEIEKIPLRELKMGGRRPRVDELSGNAPLHQVGEGRDVGAGVEGSRR